MNPLDEAWRWYKAVEKMLRITGRLAGVWDVLPSDGPLGKDKAFKMLTGPELLESTQSGLVHLDDLAIVLLFSAFEAYVRSHVLAAFAEEQRDLRHPVLRSAADEAEKAIRRGSFGKVLGYLKETDKDLVEQIRQVRIYRNWVSHGRRDDEIPQYQFHPKAVHERLSAFLRCLDPEEARA